MGLKRYIASMDTTITNAFKMDLSTRGTGSNMGASDILEVFSIYAQQSGSTGLSPELSRILLKFPTADMGTDRTAGIIPGSGSVKFYLRMFNAEHGETLPRNFTLTASAARQDWEEGTGLDMVEYTDQTYQGEGANWVYASNGTAWGRQGGTYYHVDKWASFQQTFASGTGDLEIDITTLVEQWVNSAGNVLGSKSNYGIGVQLTGTQEAYYSYGDSADTDKGTLKNLSGSTKSYYTKKFFSRTSEFFFKRPCIEARWDSADRDDRGNFYYSSSLAPGEDNLNTLFLYNYVRGRLRDIPVLARTGTVYVSLWSGSAADTSTGGSYLQLAVGGGVKAALDTFATGGWYETGIYTASLAITAAVNPIETLYDVWSTGSYADKLLTQFHTGTISPVSLSASNYNPDTRHVVSVSNLRTTYSNKEKARFRLFVRPKNWNPTIYSRAVSTPENTLIDSASYKIFRLVDNYEVVSYGTGSATLYHTHLSHDVSGNYFDFDMSMLESDFSYGIKLAFYNGAIGTWVEQPYTFKFRVEE